MVQLITAPIVGRLAVRIGFVTIFRAGIVGSIAVTALLAAFAQNRSALVLLMATFGCAFLGVTMTAMSVLGVTHAPEDAPGSLPGISNAAFGVGSLLDSPGLQRLSVPARLAASSRLVLRSRPLETGPAVTRVTAN